MGKMKLGCYYHYIYLGITEKNITLDQALEIAREHGVEAIFMEVNDLHGESPRAFRERLEHHGMYVADVVAHFPCGVKTPDEYVASLDKMKEHLRIAKQLGSPSFMPVPQKADSYRLEEHELFVAEIRRLFHDIADYGMSLGIQVSVENYSVKSLPYSTFEDLQYLLDTISGLGFVLDTGNFHLVDADEVEAAERFMEKVTGVHLKDLKEVPQSKYSLCVNGKHWDSLELGGGIIKNKEVIRALAKGGYCGPLNIEINCGPRFFDRLICSITYLKENIKEYL